MLPGDLYWAAGFIEAEGNFCYNDGSPRVRVGQKEVIRETLVRLKRLFGGRIYRDVPKRRWVISGAGAIKVMLTLFPLMSPAKQRRIQSALDQCREHAQERRAIWRAIFCPEGHFATGSWWRHKALLHCETCERQAERDVTLSQKSPNELHWAAGFIEGDGTFNKQQRVQATQNSEEPLQHLEEIFGGKTYRCRGERSRRDHFKWDLRGDQAVEVMLTLYPLMSRKRRNQINEALRR